MLSNGAESLTKIKMKNRKEVIVIWNDPKSIKNAERQKTRLENQGYNLYHTLNGFETSRLIYAKGTE